jgi:hypothetical protein
LNNINNEDNFKNTSSNYNNNYSSFKEDQPKSIISSNNNNSNQPITELNSINSEKGRPNNKITTKIEVDTEKRDTKEKFNTTDNADLNSNLIQNEIKSTGFKKKKFKERFPTSKANFCQKERNEITKHNKSPEKVTNFINTVQNLTPNLLNQTNNNNIQVFHDKLTYLKKDLFKRFSLSEKRLNDLENSFKSAFDQLIVHIKSVLPINMAFNQSPRNRQTRSEVEMINNYASHNPNNLFKETQNIVNNNTVSVNILDPTIIFRNADVESTGQKIKKSSNNVTTIKNNLQKKLM